MSAKTFADAARSYAPADLVTLIKDTIEVGGLASVQEGAGFMQSECIMDAFKANYAEYIAGGASHDFAVKHANRIALRVSRALGYNKYCHVRI